MTEPLEQSLTTMELEDLPDSEIRQRLIALGHNVGPLTPTTRAVHIKKLKNLLSMQGENAIVHEPTPPPSFSSGDGTNQLEIFDSEPIVEDEPALTQLRAPPVMPETPRAASMTAQSPQLRPSADAGDSSDGEMWGEESVRYLSPEEMELEMNYNRTSAASNVVQTGNFRKMMIVALLMALVVFVFFLSDRVHRQTAGGTVEDEL